MRGTRHTLKYNRTFSNITEYKDDVSETVCFRFQGMGTQVAVCMAGSPVVRCLTQEKTDKPKCVDCSRCDCEGTEYTHKGCGFAR